MLSLYGIFKLNDFKPLNNYLKIKKEIWKETAIYHFPEDIPPNAKDVKYDKILKPCDHLGNYNSLYCMDGYTMDKFIVLPIKSNGKYAYGFAVNPKTNQIMYFYNYP